MLGKSIMVSITMLSLGLKRLAGSKMVRVWSGVWLRRWQLESSVMLEQQRRRIQLTFILKCLTCAWMEVTPFHHLLPPTTREPIRALPIRARLQLQLPPTPLGQRAYVGLDNNWLSVIRERRMGCFRLGHCGGRREVDMG